MEILRMIQEVMEASMVEGEESEEYKRTAIATESGISTFLEKRECPQEEEIKDYILEKLSLSEQLFYIMGLKHGIRLMCEAFSRSV